MSNGELEVVTISHMIEYSLISPVNSVFLTRTFVKMDLVRECEDM